jgi:uncharacterized membrane protein YheB (UPF0754 family)
MNYWLFIIPFFSACIGWVTNWVAIKMLFHPREPRKIMGFTFQGVYPKRKQQFAEKLGRVVSNEFLSNMDLEEKISDPANLEKIIPMIESHVDDFLRERIGKELPMVSMFIGDKTIGRLKGAFMKEIGTLFPEVMKQYAGNLKTELNLEQLVVKKVNSFSSAKLEEILYKSLSKEFRQVGLLGALIGFIIGIVQVLIIIICS